MGRFPDLTKSVEDDVAFLKNEPLVKDVPISGYIVRSPPRPQLLIASMMSKQARSTRWSKLSER